MSYTGAHPTGRRYYAQSKTGKPLAFAVFSRRIRKEWNATVRTYVVRQIDGEKWKLSALVEDRPYPDELHRVNGCYVPLSRDMTPREKAEEHAIWLREIVSYEAVVVELREATSQAAHEEVTP